MIQAPKCKVCGEQHNGVEHIWPKDKVADVHPGSYVRVSTAGLRNELRAVPAPAIDKDAQIAALKSRVAELEAQIVAGRPVPKTADRAAYMREWRAKRKSACPS